MNIFFVGCKPWTTPYLDCPVMVSVNALRGYKKLIIHDLALIDSGAFTLVNKHGGYPAGELPRYVSKISPFLSSHILAIVAQDYMCESFVLQKTGLTVEEHQRYTIYRYKALNKLMKDKVYVLPVLQGYEPQEYVNHVRQYGQLLKNDSWVGVGSVCKRNSKPQKVLEVLQAIKSERPDLCLHGFGIKKTALLNPAVRSYLHSADSFAWSYAARRDRVDTDSPFLAFKYWQSVTQYKVS